MTQWVRNDAATLEMRKDPICPPDACVYDNGTMRAFVLYADMEDFPGMRWHIVLANSERRPNLVDAHAACDALLPGMIDEIAVLASPHLGDLSIHICELTEKSAQPPPWRFLQ